MTSTAKPAQRLPLLTPRLQLRRLRAEDFEPLLRLYQDAALMRFMGGPRTRTQGEELFAANLTHWERHGFGPLVVQLREAPDPDAPLLGRVALSYLEDSDDVELGYLFAAPWQGQGYACEAVEAVLGWGFAALRLPRILALTLPDNAPSLRVMRRLGMQPAGTAHHHGFDLVRYVLTRAEWQARRAAALRAGPPPWPPGGRPD